MNLLFRELKFYRKGLIFWSVGLIALIASGMAKYATMQNTGQSMTDLIAMFPQSIQAIFGLSGFDLSKASGYYGVLFQYIALMVTVHAVLIGVNVISKEERDRTSEFLFVKPISRFRILTSKIVAGMFNLIVINVVTFITSVGLVNYYAKGDSFVGDIAILMVGLFILQLIFFFVGTAVAAIHKNAKTAAPIATSFLLVTFILSFLINVNNKIDVLKYITPFKYFDSHNLMSGGGFDVVFVTISLGIILLCIIATYFVFSRRDLRV